MSNLIFILGDQLSPSMSNLRDADNVRDTILMAEVYSEVTYDLTNFATIKDWPLLITVVDLLWGTFLSISVSLVGFVFGKHFS